MPTDSEKTAPTRSFLEAGIFWSDPEFPGFYFVEPTVKDRTRFLNIYSNSEVPIPDWTIESSPTQLIDNQSADAIASFEGRYHSGIFRATDKNGAVIAESRSRQRWVFFRTIQEITFPHTVLPPLVISQSRRGAFMRRGGDVLLMYAGCFIPNLFQKFLGWHTCLEIVTGAKRIGQIRIGLYNRYVYSVYVDPKFVQQYGAERLIIALTIVFARDRRLANLLPNSI